MPAQNLALCSPRASTGRDPNEAVLTYYDVPKRIPENHILVQVQRFGFSANNVSYQALGEAPDFRYFDFHAAPESKDVSPRTHGLVPVWGFGTVVASSLPQIRVGEKVYGYLAPARYLLLPVTPSSINKYFFYVPRPHLPADRRPYNQITRCGNDAQYNPLPLREDMTMLYRPLFWTSYWCEDWLFTASYRGARRFLISSASAKTSFTMAYCVKRRIQNAGLKDIYIVGVTSKRNIAFTKSLGLYDDVVEYDNFTSSALVKKLDEKWIYIDGAGNEKFNDRVVSHFNPGGHLVGDVRLGFTTLTPSTTADKAAPVPVPSGSKALTSQPATYQGAEVFFMPEWLQLRLKQLSVKTVTAMQQEAWKDLMRDGKDWVKIEQIYGGDKVKEVYKKILKGELSPDRGMIWSLWDSPDAEEKARAKL